MCPNHNDGQACQLSDVEVSLSSLDCIVSLSCVDILIDRLQVKVFRGHH